MAGFKHLIFITSLLALASCLPEAKKTSCGPGKELNTSLRTCVDLAAAVGNPNAPVGFDQSVTTSEDTPINPLTLTPASDPESSTLYYVAVTLPAHGTLTGCMDRAGSTGTTDTTCIYTPTANYNGTDTFTYKVSDGYNESISNITVTITITAVDDPPTVSLLAPIFTEDTPHTYTFSYNDPDGDIATSCSVSTGINLTLSTCSCDALGVCTTSILPDANLNDSNTATFSFDYSITTGSANPLSDSGNETALVNAVNDTPTMTGGTCPPSITQDTTPACVAISGADVDTGDVPAQTISYDLDSNTCSWLSINSTTGALSGAPTDDHVGSCSFKYKVMDNSALASGIYLSSLVSLTITNLNPTLSPVSLLTPPGEDGGKQKIGEIRSSSSTDGSEAFLLGVDLLAYGTADRDLTLSTCALNGNLEVLPVAGFPEIKEIYYTPDNNYASQTNPCDVVVKFNDGNGGVATALQSMIVKEVNDAPTITSIPDQKTNEATQFIVDANISTTAIEPLTLDEGGGADEDGQTLTIKIESNNTTLVPHTNVNIKAYSDSSLSTPYTFVSANSTGVTFSTTDGNNESLYLVISPSAGNSGTVSFNVTISDNGTDNGGAPAINSSSDTFDLEVTDSAAIHGDWSEIYAVGAKVLYDGTVSELPTVRLAWNAFTAFNDTISGYYVYRSTSSSGPFLTPLNSTPVTTTSLTYTDSSLTESDAGVIYYYRVKAISTENGKLIDTNSTYSTQRVPVPLHNMALVPRRMANKEACMLMNKNPDKLNYNRCSYIGAADDQSGASGKFDILKDYFVDRFEASCNYTVNNSDCSETNGAGCIGSDTPSAVGVTVGSAEAIYYNRSTGECSFYRSGSWKTIANLSLTEMRRFSLINQRTQETVPEDIKSTFPAKPPIVFIQQFKAYNYCTSNTTNPSYGVTNKSLMTRLVHIAASAWSSSLTDIGSMEAGASLSSSTSQCNSSSPASLDFEDVLTNSLQDTWTGMSGTSSPRFVMSGSNATNLCVSRYGIQDLAGNVEEWNQDRFHNFSDLRLNPVGKNLGNTSPDPNETLATYMLSNSYNPYSYKSSVADSESTADITGTGTLVSFSWSTGAVGLTSFFAPLGIPTNDTTDDDTLLSGFNFNNDYFYIEDALTTAGDLVVSNNELYGVSSGGKYDDSTGAGRYTLRLRQVCHDHNSDGDCSDVGSTTASGTELNVSTGFRCMLAVP